MKHHGQENNPRGAENDMSETITTETWWHWFIEWCPKCEYNISQGPLREIAGEDCVLFEMIDAYRFDQQDEATCCRCPACNTKAHPRYRHALADWNVLEDANGGISKGALLPGQERGEYLKAIEYDLRKAGIMARKEPTP